MRRLLSAEPVWRFATGDSAPRSLVEFNGARILTGFLGWGLFALFMSWGTVVAYIVSVGLATIANYAVNVWRIFKQSPPHPAS